MLTTSLRMTVLIGLLVAGFSFGFVGQPFEGTRWKVKVMPEEDARQAGEKPFDDVLTFKGGKFVSAEFQKRGFQPAEYEEDTRRGPAAKFTAETNSQNEGKAKWTGTMTGASLQGQVVRTAKDGTSMSYSFQGERVLD
jgi:hypothetical protein